MAAPFAGSRPASIVCNIEYTPSQANTECHHREHLEKEARYSLSKLSKHRFVYDNANAPC